jgi:hypothetical protein
VVGLELRVDVERPEPELVADVLLDRDEVGDEALDRPAFDGRSVPFLCVQLVEQGAEEIDRADVGLHGGHLADLEQRQPGDATGTGEREHFVTEPGRGILRHPFGPPTRHVREDRDVLGFHVVLVHEVTPSALSTCESLPSASRKRDFAVPSGSPSSAATSRKVRPPK